MGFAWLYNNKTVLLRDTVHQISRGESAAAGLTAGLVPVPLTVLKLIEAEWCMPYMRR